MSNRIPNRNTTSLRHSIQNVELLPKRGLWYYLSFLDTDTFTIDPIEDSLGVSRIAIWINGVNYDLGDTQITLDLSTSGENGLVDGISFDSGALWYLIWAFTNESNTGTPTFGMTRKPLSNWTGLSSGGGFGTTATLTGLTNAFQFTIGARVVVTNVVGSAPDFEYNHGTVASIISDTSVTIDLDDNEPNYGTAITGATGGILKQWNKFRPYVVTSTGQTLFENNYRLLGELASQTSLIVKLYRVDEPYRTRFGNSFMIDSFGAVTNATFTAARFFPLWAQQGNFRSISITSSGAHLVIIRGPMGIEVVNRLQLAGQHCDLTSIIDLRNFVSLNYSSTANSTNRLAAKAYIVPGGMRL